MKLIKIRKRVKVVYNTFEKAAFDEYLLACLALECGGKQKIFDYIDDVTGDGSLNAHLKKLYENEIAELDRGQLERVKSSSMFPIRCENEKNFYDFYPQLNVSMLYGAVIDGDISERADFADIIKMLDGDISGEIVRISAEESEPTEKPDMYDVTISDDDVAAIDRGGKIIPIPRKIFGECVVDEAAEYIGLYKGEIYDKAVGGGWRTLGAAYLKNIEKGDGIYSFYLNGRDHCVVRPGDVKITEAACVLGLHVYRERTVRLGTNAYLDNAVMEKLCACGAVCKLKPDALLAVSEHIDDCTAVRALNSAGMENCMPTRTAELAVSLMRRGAYDGWRTPVLKAVLEHCDKSGYSHVYKAKDDLEFTVRQLLDVDPLYLSEADEKRLEKFHADMTAMKDEIEKIIGGITASGLREKSKDLQSDPEVNRFKKLCNELIGHEKTDLESFTFEQLEKRLEKVREFEKLAAVIKKKLYDRKAKEQMSKSKDR